jgi:FRG domain
VKIKDLSDYVSYILEIRSDLAIAPPKTLWFRGHANESWSLVPSIYRSRNLNYFEREMTRDFTLSASQLLSKVPNSELEWMFLMQHYGLPTRLLDWSESHLTALFFALSDYANKVDAAVWVLRPGLLNLAVLGEVTITTCSNPEVLNYLLGPPHLRQRRINALSPIALRPERNSARLTAQKGGFTLHGRSPTSLDEFIEQSNRSGKRSIPLYKIIIPGERKMGILKELLQAGISHSVLFPEIQGICAEISMRYSDAFATPGKLNELL